MYDSLHTVQQRPPPVKMPTEDTSDSTIYLLKRAELAVRGCVEEALTPFGLTPTQFLVLLRLKSSEGLSGAELARATGVRPQSITDVIGPLERDGLITRKEAPEHKRILRITLSPAGEQLLTRASPVTQRLEQDLLGNLDTQELERLRRALKQILTNSEERRHVDSVLPAVKASAWPPKAGVTQTRSRLGGSPEQRQAFLEYTQAFSNAEFERFSAYYTDDVVCELAALTLRGKNGIVGFYREMFKKVRENLTLHRLTADDNGLAADITSQFTAVEDAPEFVVAPLKKGEFIRGRLFVHYELRDGKIAYIRVARAGPMSAPQRA